MLPKSNDLELCKRKNLHQMHVFFYQRWQEMLESKTLDMYQYNILNSYTACVELLEVIDKTLDGVFTSLHNIDDVKSETLELLKEDDILKRNDTPLHNTLLRIVSMKLKVKQSHDTSDEKESPNFLIRRLKYQLTTPVRTLRDSYTAYIIKELEADINAQDKKQIEKHMGILVSQCIYNGWSASGLFSLLSIFEENIDPEHKWKKFITCLHESAEHRYEVYCAVNIETHNKTTPDRGREIINSLGLNIKKGNEINEDASINKQLNSKVNAEKNYVILSICATDPHSAALKAINMLNSKLSVATFFNLISPRIANSDQIIVYDEDQNFTMSLKITEVIRTYDYVDSNNNVFKDTKNILNDPTKSLRMSKLNAALAYTNLSRVSYFQETKYILLWIALETMMNTGLYPDNISHIKKVLPEVLSIRYFYRVVRNFSEDCIRCGYKINNELGLNMEDTDKRDLVRHLISIFRDPETYNLLQAGCERNTLLTYRCDEIRELLNNSALILNKLDHYTKKVRWHIQRLYRIRNEITHSAFQSDKSLIIYIEHLYAYLAQAMSEVVYYVEHKQADTIEEASAIILESYNTFLELAKGDPTLPTGDLLPDGVIDIIK